VEIYQSVDLDCLSRFARQNDFHLIATVPDGGTAISDWKKTGKNIILLGHEAEGLSPEMVEKSDQRISIPGHGTVESLNVALAAAIILYEIAGR
jgi:TrmH family RNA methyltransferase